MYVRAGINLTTATFHRQMWRLGTQLGDGAPRRPGQLAVWNIIIDWRLREGGFVGRSAGWSGRRPPFLAAVKLYGARLKIPAPQKQFSGADPMQRTPCRPI